MAIHTQQVREYGTQGDLVRTKQTIEKDEDGVDERSNNQLLAARVIWYIAGIILVLLAFRFAFALLGANYTNSFAHFMFAASYPFVAPFFGVFSYNYHYGVSRFETYTLVAMAVYAVIAYGIAKLLTINRVS